MEGIEKNGDTWETTKDQHQTKYNIQKIQISSASPQHVIDANIDIVKIKVFLIL